MSQSRSGEQDVKSPTELALAEFASGRYAKVAGEQQAGDWAVVLALTNE
jgi:hypothetical protein